MILTCPSCGTQYVVSDGAIPPEGRQVRCAACKHSWHQDAQDEGLVEATLIEPRSGPEAEERAYEEAALEDAGEVAPGGAMPSGDGSSRVQFDLSNEKPNEAEASSDWSEPPQAEAVSDEFAPYPAADEEEPPRRSPLVSILVVIVIVIIAAAALWFLAPADLKSRLGLAGAGNSQLALVTTHMDRQRLESGNELLTVTGRVINPTRKEQAVPPLQAQLKTRAGTVVYSWTIAPPARSLPPGSSAGFNSAEVNVPPGGDELTISLASQAG